MPMDFPDMESLKHAAENWGFLQPNNGESEESYRNALADFVQDKDIVESGEIRNKKGWDQWNEMDIMFFAYDVKNRNKKRTPI